MLYIFHALLSVWGKALKNRKFPPLLIILYVLIILVLDASGSYAGGFLSGENLRLTNPLQCNELNDQLNRLIALQNDNKDDSFNELNSTTFVPFFVQSVIAKYATVIDNTVRIFLWIDNKIFSNNLFVEPWNHTNGLHAGSLFIWRPHSNNVVRSDNSRESNLADDRAGGDSSTLSKLQILSWHQFRHNCVRARKKSKLKLMETSTKTIQ